MSLTKAASFLGVSPRTLRLAIDRGEIGAEHPLPYGPWLFRRAALQTETARALVQGIRQGRCLPAIPCEQERGFDFSST